MLRRAIQTHSSVLICAVILTSGACRAENSQKPQDVVVYQVAGRESEPPIALNPTVYRVDIGRQDVIYWPLHEIAGQPLLGAPKRLSKCVVADVKNWQCDYSDGSGKVAMVKGNWTLAGPQSELSLELPESHFRTVTKAEWERVDRARNANSATGIRE